jgi:hypothetical protein
VGRHYPLILALSVKSMRSRNISVVIAALASERREGVASGRGSANTSVGLVVPWNFPRIAGSKMLHHAPAANIDRRAGRLRPSQTGEEDCQDILWRKKAEMEMGDPQTLFRSRGFLGRWLQNEIAGGHHLKKQNGRRKMEMRPNFTKSH